jgi:predicted RNA-binding Zn-ribbon protein involved in translation (DUF1610 family)
MTGPSTSRARLRPAAYRQEPVATPVQRAAAGQSTCRDCAGVYPRTEDHADARWCPSCITRHIGRCAQCRTGFDLDGTHRLCPACREQVALFEIASGGAL